MSAHMRAALAVIFIAGATTAHAELVVMEQKGTGYKEKQQLSDGATLSVPAGAYVKFRRMPDGADVVVDGPYDGALVNYKAKGGCQWWNPACKPEKTPTPGVTRGPVPAPGATRGMD